MQIAIGALIGNGRSWEDSVDYVIEAEKLGVASIWTGEAWGFDAMTPLAYIASKTSKIKLGTSIIQIGSRTPANLLMSSLALQSMSDGRFTLGLGASGPQIMEGFHGINFKNPVRRTRELIEILRMGFSGERLQYEGQEYTLPRKGGEGKPIKSSASLPSLNVPIYIAALGPANLELTGELADGWIGGSFMPETAEVFLEKIRTGAKRTGRSIDDIDLQIPVSVEFSDDIEEISKRHAMGYGFEFGAMGSKNSNFYKNAYSRQGFAEILEEVQNLWIEGNRDSARDLVPVELALKSNLIGTDDMIRERLKLYKKVGINTLKVNLAGNSKNEKLETLSRLMNLVNELD